VEAPGVEGRGEGCAFDGLRGVSADEPRDSAGLATGDGEAGEVSSGLFELRCSSEGEEQSEEPVPSTGRASASPAAEGPQPGEGADSDVRLLKARLVALEHVLEAVGALLEAGAAREALRLVRGWCGPV
jgi:hypothetical protein